MSRPPPPEPSKDDLERLRKQTEQQWVHKGTVKACMRCKKPFSAWRKKRCRNCGDVVCTECSKNNLSLPEKGYTKPVRVCTTCYEKIVGFPSAKRGQLLSHSHGMPRIMYASTSRHGLREDNEDRICVDIKWNRDDQDDMNPKFMAFFGVFDGHSGSDTSQHLKERLPVDILARIRQGQLTPNEISHLRTMSRSSRRSSRKFEPSVNNIEEPIEEEKKLSPAATTINQPQLATLFDDPEEPSISHLGDSTMEETKQDQEFPSLILEPVASARSDGENTSSHTQSGQRLSDSVRVSQVSQKSKNEMDEKEESKNNNNHNNNNSSEIDTSEGMDLMKIVQYSCMKTDWLYGQNQLKKPNSERSHSGSCAVFVVFTNAKLKPAVNSRLRDALKWFRRTSDSANERSVNSRNERERSVSRTLLDAISPRVSPKQARSGEWNTTNLPPEQLLASPSTGVIPWLFSRGSKDRPRPIHSDLSVVCASVGDSEIVMHEKGHAPVSLFAKHNWNDVEELRRVRERGGDVREQHGVKRICVPGTLRPTLAVSRSFGDVAFKKGARITKSRKIGFFRGSEGATLKEDLVTCTPAIRDISTNVIAGDLNLLVLASDGLWDMFGHQEAIEFIQTELNEHFSKREAKKKQMNAKRRASAQDLSPSHADHDSAMPDPPPLVASNSASCLSSNSTSTSTPAPPPPPPPPPVASATPSKVDAPTPDSSSVTAATPSSASSVASTTPPTVVPFSRGNRAASMVAPTASTIVIHRPPTRRRSESFSSHPLVITSSPAVSILGSPLPSPLSSTASTPGTLPRGYSYPNSCPSTPISKYLPQTPSNKTAVSFTSTYPTVPSRLSSPAPPPPPPPPSSGGQLTRSTSSCPPPPPPLPHTPQSSTSLTVTTPPSPKSHIHVTFASSPQYFNSSVTSSQRSLQGSPPGSPSSATSIPPPVENSPHTLVSPSYTISSSPSHSHLSTFQEHEGEELLPELSPETDKASGSDYPPLVTIVSPDPAELKTPSDNFVQPRTAWTVPAPKQARRDHANAVSMDDSEVEYTGGLDAEEIEDWAALQRICDKLADTAVKRMESQPNLEGDNVSVVIIYFPS